MSDLFLDDIARAMTDVEAPVDLRARVLSEIGRPRARRWSAVVLPLTAAASIATVAVAMRPLLTDLELPAVPRPALMQLAATDPAPLITPFAGTTRRSDAPVSADELAWLSRGLPALETRVLTLDPIQPPPPSIAPISIDPITLEPISVPPPGAGSGDRR